MAQFTFTKFDIYEWDNITLTKEISEKDLNSVLALTEAQLYRMAKRNIVEKTNTMYGEKSYFAESVHIGGFRISIQANYPVWKERQKDGTPHDNMITEEEFNNVKMFEVEITHGKTKIVEPDQMTIAEIVKFLKGGLR